MKTMRSVYTDLSDEEKEVVNLFLEHEINEYELTDRLNLKYTEIGAFILVNGLYKHRIGE